VNISNGNQKENTHGGAFLYPKLTTPVQKVRQQDLHPDLNPALKCPPGLARGFSFAAGCALMPAWTRTLGLPRAAGRDHPNQAVELHTLIKEPEDMNTSDRGLKHVCPECATKYYDLKKKVVTCPKCGAKPLAAIDRKATQPARKTGRMTLGRNR